MSVTIAHLDRKFALLFAVVFGLAAVGIAVSVLAGVAGGVANPPVLRVPLNTRVTVFGSRDTKRASTILTPPWLR